MGFMVYFKLIFLRNITVHSISVQSFIYLNLQNETVHSISVTLYLQNEIHYA
jgi:hypothetical protein